MHPSTLEVESKVLDRAWFKLVAHKVLIVVKGLSRESLYIKDIQNIDNYVLIMYIRLADWNDVMVSSAELLLYILPRHLCYRKSQHNWRIRPVPMEPPELRDIH